MQPFHRLTRLLPTLAVALIALALVSGCGAAAAYEYAKPGATTEQREHDKTECLFGATEIMPGGPRVNYERYERCLADRGYTREKTTE